MITLYQFEISPFCDKIRRILAVKRVPHAIREVGLVESQTSYRKVNPTGKCPAIADDGKIVADSTEIAYYLEERYPDPPLLPKDRRDWALVHVLEDWADESLYFYEMRLRFGIAANRERVLPRLLAHEGGLMKTLAPFVFPRAIRSQMNAQGVGRKSDEHAIADVRRHLDAIDALLGGQPYLVGDRLSLADIAVASMLACFRDAAEAAPEIARRSAVAAYLDRIDRETSAPIPETPVTPAKAGVQQT
jgi:glutathione S-transferase